MNDLTMYMVTHTPVDYVPKGRTPIFVGTGDNKYNYITDCSGDNIAEKNKNYCELTALYWIWKNDCSSKYVSIEHYRRFFMKKNALLPHICKQDDIKKILQSYDVAVSQKSRYGISNEEYYRQRHYESDMNMVREAIERLHPDYIESFDNMMKSFQLSMFNMIAIDKKKFDEYCEWLFSILFDVEKKIKLDGRTKYQQRVFGFLSERLMDVWINKNSLAVYQTPIYRYDPNPIRAFLMSEKSRIPSTFTPTSERR